MSSVPASFSGTLQTVTIRGDTPHWSPYPGLRPFQPDDSEYFFGRDAQVDDVVARLRDKRFVAVIGGSGSGKSSLVLAGAIPRLRTYAIKDAGDFWVPVIATPGTNHVEGDSPLRRLAHKFCSELVESSDASTRLEACVTLLRRQDGLGELVERFGGQIKGAGSVDLKLVQVNFLFLVDQFEELFHPSNERSPLAADCQHLVDRIVEQFKKQHPQVCVALTMRSEHLNDCPRYDELPDAINAASYLVKRLNREQLRNAIEQPVQRYHDKYLSEQRSARRQARREGQAQVAAPSISTPIVIEENLIVRLLDDSKAVLAERGHADQLPLLQHLLFWIWYEASERCKDQPLVDALTLDDLWKAVGQSPDNQTRRPDSSINTLEACLQNRCEAIFTDHVIEQKAWQEVFRSLAFKEPNTGTYTQQRASMTELRQRLGIITGDNVELAAHLQPWMKPHGYLHWDQDSGTVKVTHETLIRRWKLFRDWIDEEDRQFRVYLRLLDDCERWKTARVSGGGLSGGDTLRRYEDEQLPVILKDPVRVARINRLLGMDRDGKRLTTVAADAVRFLDLSIESRSKRERERDEVEKAALQSRDAAEKEKAGRVTQRLWLLLLAVVVILLLPLTIWVKTLAEAEKQLANKERALNRSYALAVETLVGFQPQFRDLAGPQGLLRYSLIGSHFLDDGRQLTTSPAHWPLINRYYETRLKALRTTERFSEARNTESLRTILQGAVWAVPGKVNSLGRTGHQQCKAYQFALSGTEKLADDAYFFRRPGTDQGSGLILATTDVNTPNEITSVSVGSLTRNICTIERQLLSTPPKGKSLQPARVGIADDASNIVIAFAEYAQFHSVMWDAPTGVYAKPRATVSIKVIADLKDPRLPSSSNLFWTDVTLGNTTVRLFDIEPSAITDVVAVSGQLLTHESLTARDPVCGDFAKTQGIDLTNETVWGLRTKNSGGTDGQPYCLRVASFQDTAGSTVYSASLYGLRTTAAGVERDKDLPLINQLPLGANAPVEFRLNVHEGWMAFRVGIAWRAVPWSLDAFRVMAGKVFDAGSVDVKNSPPATSSTVNGNKRQGCGRPSDDPQFNVPYSLILGDMACPSDAVLKVVGRVVPASAPPAARTAGEATAR